MPLLRRCLGIHYHRVGKADKALAVFEEAQWRSGEERNVHDVIFIDSELAEIYTFRGQYEAAEKASHRGLERLERVPTSDPFYGSMALTLRASLGHLKMRRMDLVGARTELARALGSCRRHGTTANRAAILNNLGITASQQDDYSGAIRYFKEAEKLSSAAGEQRGTIKIASNLALVHAKLGDRDEARRQLEVARSRPTTATSGATATATRASTPRATACASAASLRTACSRSTICGTCRGRTACS